MSNWKIYIAESGSLGSWDEDERGIPRPNEDLDVGKTSTQQAVQLADGSIGYFTPETKATRGDLTFVWVMRDNDLREQLEAYIDSHDYIKIETHISGFEFIGRFTGVTSKWLVGEEPDEFLITAIFSRMEAD
jgi:hypothetical protein